MGRGLVSDGWNWTPTVGIGRGLASDGFVCGDGLERRRVGGGCEWAGCRGDGRVMGRGRVPSWCRAWASPEGARWGWGRGRGSTR
eukprot:9486272-Pyramimonas_sp.AAC.1